MWLQRALKKKKKSGVNLLYFESQGISYAKAVKKVSGDTQVSIQIDTRNKDTGKCGGCDKLKGEL